MIRTMISSRRKKPPLKNLTNLTPGRSVVKVLAMMFCLAGPGFLMATLAGATENRHVLRGEPKKPVVLYISRTDCHFCHLLEEEIIKPLLRSGEYSDKIIFRNLVLDSAELVADIKGKLISPTDLARALEVELTPTLLFLDHKYQELAPRIVGYQRSEYYFYYLEKTIDNAIKALNRAPAE